MKKSVLTLLILLCGFFQNIKAWDYFTIYFHDGTKSEKFYAADVDSICYSKIGVDSILYSEWQVQEIWTIDSIYRYPLSQIDSLSFVKVNINELTQELTDINNTIAPLFIECNSTYELYNRLSSLPNLKGVEEIQFDGGMLNVRIKDWIPVSFFYSPQEATKVDNLDYLVYGHANTRSSYKVSLNLIDDHQHMNASKACIINQQHYDEDPGRDNRREITTYLSHQFESMGIETMVNNKPLLSFFDKELFNYDLVFMITHGGYDSLRQKHWLLTGDELYCYNSSKTALDWEKSSAILQKLQEASIRSLDKDFGLTWIKEKRNGLVSAVFYIMVSDNYIANASGRFTNSAIVFNAACESLEGNDNMGRIFIDKGAGCYIGYEDSNFMGQEAGAIFFVGMLNGKSVYSSYSSIPENLRQEHFYKYDGFSGWYQEYFPIEVIEEQHNAKLICIPEVSTLCIFHPQTNDIEENNSTNKTEVHFKGSQKTLRSTDVGNQYGFQYSTIPDMSQQNKALMAEKQYYDHNTNNVNFETTLDIDSLQPNTTYYYRAYMNDGYSNCYGEIKQFKTKSYELYYVKTENDSICTLYYDDKKEIRKGILLPGYSSKENLSMANIHVYSTVKKIIFDPSIKNIHPQSIYIGGKNITSIDGLEYLNTDKVKNMQGMFYDSSIKELDLSHFDTSNVENFDKMFASCDLLETIIFDGFDTSNVKNMSSMFAHCKSLKSLNLNNFDTSNVTNMFSMFGGCISLKSLNLMGFNTSNVTNMRGMFSGCNSLEVIYITSFNTSNVTNMECMFSDCSSMSSLDLTSFDTSNVTNMAWMFDNCKSLKTIYGGNWQNINKSAYMFSGCNELVGGKGTKMGANYYYDEKGIKRSFHIYDYSGSYYAHIDEGPENPGLFTSK